MKNNDRYITSRRTFLNKSITVSIASALSLNGAISVKETGNSFDFANDEKGLTIVFHGDSITDGARGRSLDPNHIMGHGYVFSIVSRVGADFPQSKLMFYNRGVGSTKLSDLKKRWQTDALDLKPDVLSILMGVNDSNAYVRNPSEGDNLDQFETDYREMLSQVKQQNPNIIFVVGLPFIFPVGKTKEQWDLWNANMKLRQDSIRKIASDFDAILVDYPSVFERATKRAPIDYWVWDGIHPTVPGHELLTREWIKQVSAKLTFLKYYK